jgi:hypothetical protein
VVKIDHSYGQAPPRDEVFDNEQATTLVRPDTTKMWSVTVRELIFAGKQCRILVMRDLGPIRQNMKLQSQNKMMSLLQSSISHEMLTPIRCIIETLKLIKKRVSRSDVEGDLRLVINTSHMLQNQIKGSLDRNLLDQNEF